METFTNVKKFVDKIMNFLCIVILMIMTVLVTYQVVARYFFSKPSAISEAVSQYLFVWMVMFGSALVFGERGHLEITAVKDKLPPTAYMVVEILANISLIVFSILVLLYGGVLISQQQMATVDAATQIPMGLIYASIPFCGVISCFYAVYNILLAVKEWKNHSRTISDPSAGTM